MVGAAMKELRRAPRAVKDQFLLEREPRTYGLDHRQRGPDRTDLVALYLQVAAYPVAGGVSDFLLQRFDIVGPTLAEKPQKARRHFRNQGAGDGGRHDGDVAE